MNKSEYRKYYKNIRNNIRLEDANKKSDLIFKFLSACEEFRNAKTVFLYMSYNNEVLTDRVISYLQSNDAIILIPWCNTEDETMQAVVFDKNSTFEKNTYGIDEITNPQIYNGDIDVTIVPGIAFDRCGNRIGYGKGYYDKFFESISSYKIGLCYSDTLIDDVIPSNENDITMDCIITDREVLKF